jgi:hypothetical protein
MRSSMRRIVLGVVLVAAAVATGIGLSARAAVGKDCGTAIGTFPTEPHKRQISTPPAPGLVVTQIAPQTFRFEWSFPRSTAGCRPAWISLRVEAASPPPFGPNLDLKVAGLRGVYIMKVPDFFTVVSASATAFDVKYAESPVTSVRIRH